jgi:hypothetical protein
VALHITERRRRCRWSSLGLHGLALSTLKPPVCGCAALCRARRPGWLAAPDPRRPGLCGHRVVGRRECHRKR